MKVCRIQWLFIVLVALLGTTQIMTACGNKGPLYLPSEKSEQDEDMAQKHDSQRYGLEELERLEAIEQAEEAAEKAQ